MAERLTEAELVARLREALAEDGLRTLSASAKKGEAQRRIQVRVWGEKGSRKATLTESRGKKQIAQETLALEALAARAPELVAGFVHWELVAAESTLHARRAKKAILVTEGKTPGLEKARETHDRSKNLLLDPKDTAVVPLLKAIGLAAASGHVLPGRERKLRQVERFVQLVREAIEPTAKGRELTILDAGCGAAYLTFALRHVLARDGARVRLVGVDVSASVIEKARATAKELGVEGDVSFVQASVREASLDAKPDLVLSLHACDTATDEAIARGVALGARAILAVPCCQHELHHKIASAQLSPILRHGILRERLADLATDALRAAILRGAGYRTDVVEFVDAEATAKNLLIRAVLIEKKQGDDPRWREDVLALKRELGLEGPVELERLLAR